MPPEGGPRIVDAVRGSAASPDLAALDRGHRLARLARERLRELPDVPTMQELGYPNFDVNPWWGILAPAGTPRAIVDKVNADVAEILRAPETQAFLKDQGSEALILSPREFHNLLVGDVEK